ncbi:MAG: chemotaxis protein CheA, partial [Bacteroidales bacterium]|nr:chemotaxis protein CheA [Bacteroidales bacterium]
EKKSKKSYYILFQPSKQILKDGTNPLYLIDELHDLGEAQVVMHSNKLPGISEYDYTLCYIYWEIYLVTEYDEQHIKDVFLFVEDSSVIDIQMLSYDAILTEPELAEAISQLANTNSKITLNEIKGQINQKRADINKKTAIINKREQKITSIRVSSEKLDSLMNLVSELVTTQARLSLFAEEDTEGELTSIAENVQKLTRQLRDIAFSIVLIPIDTIVMRFQRLVRDLSKNLNKKVDFVAKGTDTELDKTLIESLVDPIMHIIRNSIDHGIETIDERRRAGKKETGTIKLNAYYSGVNVHIDISDDGKGINKDKVLQQAISKGIVAEDANLSDDEIYNLIFLPGFSTAATVTDVSGRGVGMDVVKKKVNEIRGEVSVSSGEGVGTVISIVIPITLSIIDGLLVVINKHHFIVPMVVVDKIYSIKHSDLQQSFNDILVLDGEQVPYIHIKSKFELDGEQVENEEVVIATYNGKKIGLVIDSVVGEYQAVLKPLGNQFRKQDYITGASILGDGRIALVLDTNKMIKQIHEQKTVQVAQV